jgi:aminodeoxyfutalosine deaminase
LYRKFSADNIFTGYQMLDAGNVLITETDGKIIEIVPVSEAGDDIQYFKGILSPGFINAHCHLELSHMKGHIPEHTGLVDFVFKVISERDFTEEEIFAAIEKADNEMYDNGIVAVGDICNTVLTISQKQKSKIQYYNFIEASGFPPSVADIRFQRSLDFYKQYKERFANNSIVPHAPYSVSPELFEMIDTFPCNKVLTIHNQETKDENELFEKGEGDFLRLYEKLGIDISFFKPSGKTSLQTYLPHLKSYESLILVHNVFTNKEDIGFEKNQTSQIINHKYYCLCPNANLYITNTLPGIDLLIKEEATMVLGTDSLASNHQLNIVEEIKTLQKHFPLLSTEKILQWATINGAAALQMNEMLGSFEKGKTPGVVLIQNIEKLCLTANSTSVRII